MSCKFCDVTILLSKLTFVERNLCASLEDVQAKIVRTHHRMFLKKRKHYLKLWIVVEILKRRKFPFKVVAGLCISTTAKAKAKKVSKEDFPVLILVLMFFLVHNCVYWRFSSVVTLSIFHFPSFHRCSQYVWHPLLNTHSLTTDMDIGGAEIFVGFAFSKAI